MKVVTLGRLLYRRFVKNDIEAGLNIVRPLGNLLMPGYRFSYPQIAWWKNEPFNEYLRRFDELNAYNSERHWMLLQFCRLTAAIAGDTAECGVFRGASSYLICMTNEGRGKRHHIFDSFEGLSIPGSRDGDYWREGALSCGIDDVKRNLGRFRDVEYYKGWIPQRFQDVADRAFSFVHIDVDLEQPTIDSIAFFYPRMSPGGIIVCDDYGFTTCPGATKAIDEFFADKPEKMLAQGGGGGFMVKGTTVGSDSMIASR